MITESDSQSYNGRTTFVWSLCTSLLVNFLAWMLALWIANFNFVQLKHEKPELVVSSTSITISHRVQPQPRQPSVRVAPQQQPQPQRQEPQKKRQVAVQRPVVDEPAKTLAQQLAQQEETFAKTAAQLRSQNSLLSTANAVPIQPSTFRRDYANLNGRNLRETIETVLEPSPDSDSHRIENGQSCYYNVHYYAQYSHGGNEEGSIPWPVCYPAKHDAMLPLDRPHDLPVPTPPLGYVLPAGTPLGPLLQGIYTGAIHR